VAVPGFDPGFDLCERRELANLVAVENMLFALEV
jgi:hypothetical protein